MTNIKWLEKILIDAVPPLLQDQHLCVLQQSINHLLKEKNLIGFSLVRSHLLNDINKQLAKAFNCKDVQLFSVLKNVKHIYM